MTHTLSALFAYPPLLATLAVPPLLALCFVVAYFRRRRALAQLGGPLAVQRLTLLRPGVRYGRTLCTLLGLALLAVACAGPQWGKEHGQGQAAHGDLVLALDLSRSMDAEQPSRRERALRGLHDLADELEKHGGPRVALVVFAGKPRLLFPLTRDYDHFRHALRRVAEGDYPPLQPGPDEPFPSGTRIGAALRLAVAALDAQRAGPAAVLLLSDGDDPAEDQEWLPGTVAAHARHVPVHVVGVGDPDRPRPIVEGDDFYRHGGTVVQSRLNESVLREIARRTGGTYLPVYAHALPLGAIVPGLLARSEADADPESLPVARPRYAWFLAPALLCLALGLLLGDGPRRPRRLLLVVLFGAAPLLDVEEALRRGNEAFAARDFDAALRHYAAAEPWTTDPGLVAFNQAAAHFRLGNFDEAVAHYRRSLEDEAAPPARRGRAWYDLGTALAKQAGTQDAKRLAEAVEAYRAALRVPGLDADLAADARHNLKLTQLLWLKARARSPQNHEEQNHGETPQQSKDAGTPESKEGDGKGDRQAKGEGRTKQQADGGEPGREKGKVQAGPLQVLPDQDRPVTLPPDQAEAHLEAEAERIARQRRRSWQQSIGPAGNVKDW